MTTPLPHVHFHSVTPDIIHQFLLTFLTVAGGNTHFILPPQNTPPAHSNHHSHMTIVRDETGRALVRVTTSCGTLEVSSNVVPDVVVLALAASKSLHVGGDMGNVKRDVNNLRQLIGNAVHPPSILLWLFDAEALPGQDAGRDEAALAATRSSVASLLSLSPQAVFIGSHYRDESAPDAALVRGMSQLVDATVSHARRIRTERQEAADIQAAAARAAAAAAGRGALRAVRLTDLTVSSNYSTPPDVDAALYRVADNLVVLGRRYTAVLLFLVAITHTRVLAAHALPLSLALLATGIAWCTPLAPTTATAATLLRRTQHATAAIFILLVVALSIRDFGRSLVALSVAAPLLVVHAAAFCPRHDTSPIATV